MKLKNKAAVLIIAEVAQAHGGNVEMAHSYIEAIANTGVNAVKFQTHIAMAESTLREPFRVALAGGPDKTRFDYWKRMEFTPEQWEGLARHAREKGLEFLSTPFSLEAFELLKKIGVKRWKIGSGEITTGPLLDVILKTRKPIILSTGMSPSAEISKVVKRFRGARCPFSLLQCTTKYPCPAEEVGLNVMLDFKKKFRCPVGLSDHSGTIFPSLAAVSLGASVVEVHTVLDRHAPGFDVQASVTMDELKTLVEGIRFLERMLASPVNKDKMAKELQALKKIFSKSVVAKGPLAKGTVLRREHLAFKKPGGGVSPDDYKKVLGKKLVVDLQKDDLILKELVK